MIDQADDIELELGKVNGWNEEYTDIGWFRDLELDQAEENDVEPGGAFIRKIGLAVHLSKPVKVVKKGQVIQDIELQVPFTKTFLKTQRELGMARRKMNRVLTSKYSPYSFVPVAGGYQFRRFTNMFFLVIAILTIAGWYTENLFITPFSPGSTISVLCIVVGAALIFEGYDDYQRHMEDKKQNGTKIMRIRREGLENTTWGDLMPGDLVVVSDKAQIPADLILVYSSGADKHGSICYVETSGIDGETNLKIKEVVPYVRKHVNCNNVYDLDHHTVINSTASGPVPLVRATSVIRSDWEKRKVAEHLPPIVSGSYTFEQPNSFLQFNGKFKPVANKGTEDHYPIDFSNLLLRGSTLRNTKWIIGIVAYAGPETKLQLSKKKSPAKFGRIDIFVNRSLMVILYLYIAMIILFDILLFTVADDTNTWWYFSFTSSKNGYKLPGPIAYFCTYGLLFANIMPIPILFAIEVTNFYQRYVMENDIKMYHDKTDTAARCKTSNLVCEVGQITHVFSDKTGTLTRNEMKLVGVYIGGKMYGHQPPELTSDQLELESEITLDSIRESQMSIFSEYSENNRSMSSRPSLSSAYTDDDELSATSVSEEGDDDSVASETVADIFADVKFMLSDSSDLTEEKKALMDYFTFLAVCHTVVVDFDENGKVCFNAESPDEEAFVSAAAAVGIILKETSDGVIVIEAPEGRFEYRVLVVNSFNSTRKRMSIVLRRVWDDSVVLMMKGADNVMFKRLADGQEIEQAKMSSHLLRYSWAGLRTLVMGKRELSTEEFEAWEAVYKEAQLQPGALRSEALAAAAEKIEQNVTFVGASAIEDQLQVGVPEAIQTIRDAGVQVWVLTGDKIETAINIGLSSNLIDARMFQLKLVSTDVNELTTQLNDVTNIMDDLVKEFNLKSNSAGVRMDIALIVSGQSLEFLLHRQKGSAELEAKLLGVAKMCKVVLACRVSPAQKSLIVEMVRFADVQGFERSPVTLAIGDGANDVPMIQSAHVGVGISGHEGMQAVNNSDFAIAQFRFLVRLMLVHGRWNYRRQANMIVYIIYSWLVYIWIMAVYLPFSLYSGQQVYYYTAYAAVFAYWANVCICTFGWFDKDISDDCAIRNPWTYVQGIESRDLNNWKTLSLIMRSFLHTGILGACIFAIFPASISLESLGTGLYMSVVIVLFVRQATMGTTFTAVTMVVFILMISLFLIFLAFVNPLIYEQGFGMVWVGIIVSVGAVLMVEMAIKFVRFEWFPSHLQILIEQDRGFFHGEKLTARAHRDALKVLEETAKLSVMPFALGFENIKHAVQKKSAVDAESNKLKKHFTHVSARNNFDYDYTSAGDRNDENDSLNPTAGDASRSRFFMIRPMSEVASFMRRKSSQVSNKLKSGKRKNSYRNIPASEPSAVSMDLNTNDASDREIEQQKSGDEV